MEKNCTRVSDMAGAPSVSIIGGSVLVRWCGNPRLVAAFESSPTQVPQRAHGPARDVVAAGGVAEEARQDVEVASSSKPIMVFPVCAPNMPQLTGE
jgi:hypothetical protein